MIHQYNFSYNDMLVEVFYFKGRKVDFHFNCEGNIIQGGVSKKKKIPACSKQICEACSYIAGIIDCHLLSMW